VFLACVIAVPNKPSTEQINRYLQVIVEVLQEFWHSGFFTRTYRSHDGRLARGMAIPLVCDMSAGR
ncbi:hypothetical protein BKA70DRAFT_1086954, partial [Coprinopsis sp. MPI-PUGE-AT-0042]